MKKNPNKNDSPQRSTRSTDQLARDFADVGKVAGSLINKNDEADKKKNTATGKGVRRNKGDGKGDGKGDDSDKNSGVRKNKRQSPAKDDEVRSISLISTVFKLLSSASSSYFSSFAG